jgi:hypothetical protein
MTWLVWARTLPWARTLELIPPYSVLKIFFFFRNSRILSVFDYRMLVSLLQVAGILVHLARLTLLKIISDIKVSNDLSRSHLVKAKQLVSDSIRYCLLAPFSYTFFIHKPNQHAKR